MQEILAKIIVDPRYLRNLDWGEPRSGHPEGAIRDHIAELENNLAVFRGNITDEMYWKLRVLIHTHDTFKPQAMEGAAIADPQSHASLARAFLEEYCSDQDLLNMVQYHDEGHALWKQFAQKGRYNQERFENLLATIMDWELFLRFVVIDGCTKGKSREPVRWFLSEVNYRIQTSVGDEAVL